VSEEAKEFVNTLRRKGNVYFITAIGPRFMSHRAEQILTAFPDFPENNIIMGFQKTLVQFDVTLDDGPHNILKSGAKYPVLYRKPWNRNLSGVLSVNNYYEFLQLVDQIKESMVEDKKPVKRPCVIALVGPSGSNKNEVANLLYADGIAEPVHSYVVGRSDSMHQHISGQEFAEHKDEFVTATVYAGNQYGVKISDISKILGKGKCAVIPLDICGAISMKRLFSTVIVFCKNSRENMITDILEKDIDNTEKKYRLLSIEKELENAKLCDYIVRAKEPEAAVREVKQILMEK
jgi:guanylate kinase